MSKTRLQIARDNKASAIRLFNQNKWISRYNSNFFVPWYYPPLNKEGACYGLTSEWYWQQRTNKSLVTLYATGNLTHSLTQKINSLQKYHKNLVKGIPSHLQPFDRGGKFRTYGLKPMEGVCQVIWVDPTSKESKSLFSVAIPTDTLHQKATYEIFNEGDCKETQESPENKASFFGKNQFDFKEIINRKINLKYPGSLKEIILVSQTPPNHCMGFTYRLNENCEQEYVVFDPNFAEITFKTLENAKQFLCEHIENLYFEQYKDYKKYFFRVDVDTFTDTGELWPKNSAIRIKNNLLKGQYLENIYPLLKTKSQVAAILKMAGTPIDYSIILKNLQKDSRVALLLPSHDSTYILGNLEHSKAPNDEKLSDQALVSNHLTSPPIRPPSPSKSLRTTPVLFERQVSAAEPLCAKSSPPEPHLPPWCLTSSSP